METIRGRRRPRHAAIAGRTVIVPIALAVSVAVALVAGADAPAGAREAAAPGPAWTGPATFRRPVPGGGAPARAFDPPEHRWLSGHRGVDLASTPGGPVRAPGPGRVVFAGRVGDKPVVSVDHPGGLRTTYEPVTASVAVGTEVVAGDLLGHLSPVHPGCPVSTCLHWGARVGEEYVDPMSLLAVDTRPIRLLPLRPGDRG